MNMFEAIQKGNTADSVLLTFPHDTEKNRNPFPDQVGRNLGPHSFMRFFPKITLLGKNSRFDLSYLGDVLRPKQFVKHKYHHLKTHFSLEELLDDTRKLIASKIFKLDKQLIFIASFEETFYPIYEASHQSNQPSNDHDLILIFSPFLYLKQHYQELHIRSDSFMRKVVEFIEKNKKNATIIYFGFDRRTALAEELKFLQEKSHLVKTIEAQNVDEDSIQSLVKNIETDFSLSNKFIFFSFNVFSSACFPGKSFANCDSQIDSRLGLILFRRFAGLKNIKSLSFHDYNPQIEDYTSGVFFATLLFEFLDKKRKMI